MTEGNRSEDRGPAIIAPPPLLYAAPLLAGFVLDLLLPLPRLPAALRLGGLPFLAAGIALAIWFLLAMRGAGTPVDPREATTALVQSGPFRYSRNPAYVAFTLTYLGVSLLVGARWPLVLLPVVLVIVDRGVIRREERYLEARFGSDYSGYQRHVRRWL
jgi:protein-S-isoprenylcysteine O-methyltransferase Ste14